MSFFKVIVFLLIISAVVVDSRARRKRRQEPRSSAYYTNSNFGTYSGVDYALNLLGFGASLYPIGNNWYVPGNPQYQYINQFGYNAPPYPYIPGNGYMNSFNSFGGGQDGNSNFNLQYSSMGQSYTGQSYVPQSNEWLPLPGVDRRGGQLFRSAMAPNANNNRPLLTRK